MEFYDKVYDVCEKVDNKLRDGGVYAEVFPYGHELPVFVVAIHWGDWKHDHLRATYLVEDFFNKKKEVLKVVGAENITEENGSDCYSATHMYKIIMK